MQIQGIGSISPFSSGSSTALGDDGRLQQLQQQIQQLQKEMQDLSQNDELSMEEKMKKRQEINQEIQTLRQQVQQVQREIRKQENQKKQENSIDELAGGSKQKQSATMTAGKIRALIAGDKAMEQADVGMKTSSEMDARAKVLQSEIYTDQLRGIDTGQKEEELSDIEQRSDLAKAEAIRTASEASEEIQKTEEEDKEIADKRESVKQDKENQENEEKASDGEQESPVHVDVRL